MPETGMAAFERWRALVPPPEPDARLGPPVDWTQVESELGLRLPADYKAYVDTYGFGWVNRLVCVFHPTTKVPQINLAQEAEAHNNPDLLEMVETPPPHPLGVGVARLMCFGGTETQDALYWFTDGEDPDRWPVVFRDQAGYEWRQYDLSLVGFLLALFTREIAPAAYAEAGYLRDDVVFEPNPWGSEFEV
jgi:hypothetical protein